MQKFHKSNMILWGAITSGLVILTAVVYYLDTTSAIAPVQDSQDTAQLMFVAAVVLAIVILVLKRSVLAPAKIVQHARGLPEDQAKIFVMSRLKKNYIIIWALAELICLLGFFNYMLLSDFQNYLIFAIVSIYSMLVNMPREALLFQSLDLLKE